MPKPSIKQLGTTLLILGILALALGLRLWGITLEDARLQAQDEFVIVEIARHMIKTWDFNPHYFQIPTFYIYLQAFAYNLIFVGGFILGEFLSLDSLDDTFFVFGGRILSAILGTLTVAATYKLGTRLYGRATGMIAGAFLAVLSIHVINSQFITTDTPLTLFLVLTVSAAATPLLDGNKSKPGTKEFLTAGVWAGLALASRFIGILAVIPLIVAQVLKPHKKFYPSFWISLILGSIIFALTSPYLFLEPGAALSGITDEFRLFDYSAGLATRSQTFIDAFTYLFGDILSLVILILSIIGIATALGRKSTAPQTKVILSLVVSYTLTIVVFFQPLDRLLLPILPFLTVFATLPIIDTVGLLMSKRNIDKNWQALLIIVILLAAYPLYQSIATGLEKRAEPIIEEISESEPVQDQEQNADPQNADPESEAESSAQPPLESEESTTTPDQEPQQQPQSEQEQTQTNPESPSSLDIIDDSDIQLPPL